MRQESYYLKLCSSPAKLITSESSSTDLSYEEAAYGELSLLELLIAAKKWSGYTELSVFIARTLTTLKRRAKSDTKLTQAFDQTYSLAQLQLCMAVTLKQLNLC